MSSRIVALLLSACALIGCDREAAGNHDATRPSSAAQTATTFEPIAGIQDIMADMIDPAADFLWESVSTTFDLTGVVDKEPRTDQEWDAVRRQAIILTEGANLIAMEGRRVARVRGTLEDHGTPGNLTAEESEHAIANDRGAFLAFAKALHEVGHTMLKASDDRSPQGLLDAGDTLDRVCEGCHLKFWYPGQAIPPFPGQAPEVDER